MLLDALFVQAGQAALLVLETAAFVPAGVRLTTTLVHQVDAILLATHVGECRLIAYRRLSEWFPAESALERDLVLFCLLAVHSNMVRVFLATSAEVVRARRTPDTVSSHVFGGLPRHRLILLILRSIIWLRRIEGKYVLAVRTLHDVIGIGHQYLRLLLTDVLEPLLAEGLAEVVRLHYRIALPAPAFGEVPRWQLRQQLLLGIRAETLDVELMEAAFGQEHLHLASRLVSIRDLCHTVHAAIRLKGTHVDVLFSLYFFAYVVLSCSPCRHTTKWTLLHLHWTWLLLLYGTGWNLLMSDPLCHIPSILSLHDYLLLASQVLLDIRAETCQ